MKAIIKSTEQTVQVNYFGTPRRRYERSRKEIVVDGFDEEAIRRRIHTMHSLKEHVTHERLLVSHTYWLVFIIFNGIFCPGSTEARGHFQRRGIIASQFIEKDGVSAEENRRQMALLRTA